jgi:predicted aspartyl protease
MKAAAFDRGFDPPAPVLTVRIAGAGDAEAGVVLRMLVDTGADCSLIPMRVARALRLPLVSRVHIQGVAGAQHQAGVHAARVQIGTFERLSRLVAFGDECLLGRDLLNQLVLRIDGPKQAISVARPRR